MTLCYLSVTIVHNKVCSQVRSHAQKHFIRLEKKGLGSVVPPARRKARWSDKQPADSLDGSTDSDQDLSGMHQQTNSSSSISTFDYHQARASVGSAAQCAAGIMQCKKSALWLTPQPHIFASLALLFYVVSSLCITAACKCRFW